MLRTLLIALFALCVASPTVAQDSQEQYRAIATEGQEAFNEGNYALARDRWLRARELLPNPRISRLLGRVALELGDHAEAARSFRRALSEPDNGNPLAPEHRAEVETDLLPRALAQVGELAIDLEPDAAVLTVDGSTPELFDGVLVLEVGTHQLRATHDGYVSLDRAVNVRAGARESLSLSLSPGGAAQTPAPSQSGEWQPGTLTWIGTGVTAAGLVGGLVFGLLALSEQSNFDAMPLNETADRMYVFAGVCDAFLGLAAVGAVLAVIGLATGTSGHAPVSFDGGRLVVAF